MVNQEVGQVQVVLIDDIDGGPADETVRFSVDGSSFEIDLSAANAARLRQSFAEFIGHARKSSGRSSSNRSKRSRRADGGKSAEIRAWARETGLPVNERGRIPADLTAKFEAAH
jgi:hypothetical protein